jgi:hypothetical protein
MPRSSKRKRAARVEHNIPNEDDEVEVVSAPEDDEDLELDIDRRENQRENGYANPLFEVEAELWDTFREEFHECAHRTSCIIHG